MSVTGTTPKFVIGRIGKLKVLTKLGVAERTLLTVMSIVLSALEMPFTP